MSRGQASPIGIVGATALREWSTHGDQAPLVIDARTQWEYEQGHIPGAIWLGWEEYCERAPVPAGSILVQDGYWGGLANPPAALAARLDSAGIQSDRNLVVYADGPRSKGREGRIAWMLLYLGARSVHLLDRGWRGWLAQGGPVEAGPGNSAPGQFTLDLDERRRARLHDLKPRYLAGTPPLFVDTRGPEEFAGVCYPYLPRMGRLPSSVLFAFTDLFEADESFVTPSVYRERLPVAARISGDLVTYCEVGVRASLTSLLHEIVTARIVPVFDGSLIAWGLDPDLPVTR